jgi:hypothetical protein
MIAERYALPLSEAGRLKLLVGDQDIQGELAFLYNRVEVTVLLSPLSSGKANVPRATEGSTYAPAAAAAARVATGRSSFCFNVQFGSSRMCKVLSIPISTHTRKCHFHV